MPVFLLTWSRLLQVIISWTEVSSNMMEMVVMDHIYSISSSFGLCQVAELKKQNFTKIQIRMIIYGTQPSKSPN
jgi:hypothetical protein